MPDVLLIKIPHWELMVWSKDISKQKHQLTQSYHSRGENLPGSAVSFSNPQVLYQVAELDVSLPIDTGPCSQLHLTQPIFFESTQYEFEFVFDHHVADTSMGEPRVKHELSSVNNLFHYVCRRDVPILRGNINFGSHVGWFHLPICYPFEGSMVELTLSFEVWPTSVENAPEIDKMHLATDFLYPLWSEILPSENSHQDVCPLHGNQSFVHLWLAQFEPLRQQLEQAYMTIIHSPHSELVTLSNRPRPNGPLKKHDNFRTDIKSGSYNRRYQLAKQVLSFDTAENRFVKMVLLSTVEKLDSFLEIAKRYESMEESRKLPEVFYHKLSQWLQPFEFIRDHSMFKEVGVFAGLEHESMVLQQREGYDLVFRHWHMLSLYLDVLGAQASIVISSPAELYQIWTFIQLKRMICELGFVEVDCPDHGLTYKNFQLRTNDGFCGGFSFERHDGVKVRLTHEPVFQFQTNPQVEDHTTNPHILLEIQYPNSSLAYWLFNVSYDVDLSDEFGREYCLSELSRQLVALRQISRYQAPAANDNYGVFLLYPHHISNQTQANVESNLFYSSIVEQGVGAFPFMPKSMGQTNWLELWLNEQLNELTVDSHLPQYADVN